MVILLWSQYSDLLLFDTHIWVWLMEGSDRLPCSIREDIQAGVTAHQLRISAISVWEVAMLEAKQRIVFDMDCGVWVIRALAAPGISLMPLHPEIAVASTRLPGGFHGDPVDRIIVASAHLFIWRQAQSPAPALGGLPV